MIWVLVLAVFAASSSALNVPIYQKTINSVEDSDEALSSMCDGVAAVFENEYVQFMRTGIETPKLTDISRQLAESHTKDITISEVEDLSIANQIFMCTTCRSSVNVIVRMFREGGELAGPENDHLIRDYMLDICIRLKIQTAEVCEGLIDINFSIAKYIVQNSGIDSRSFCGTFLHSTFCKVQNEAYNWTLSIDSSRPAIEGPKSNIPPRGNKDLTILHITDIHYDPLYIPGALADCEEPQCCQRHKDVAEGTNRSAGYWGDYRNCDSPLHTVVDSLKQMKKNHESIDYIYHTGDVIAHIVWMTSREKNIETLQQINQLLKDTFGDIPIYPLVGNHEAHPLNIFAPPSVTDEELSTQWLYDFLADLWSVWLPESTKETIKKGGYYTLSPRPGFRIIALNNNNCYNLNWWILYDGNYLSEQLKWLHDVLLKSEEENEFVHILAHIPTGMESCWRIWSREFGRIVERFSGTVSGIFNGHTHKDEMSLYYSNGTVPINVAWNGGSLTTYNNLNPNYKTFRVEPTSFQVVEQEAWYFNLTAANLKPDESPTWLSAYKLTEAFELKDLSPASVDGLLTKFAESPSVLRKYWRLYIKQSDPYLKKKCNAQCLKNLICLLARGDNTQLKRCEELQVKLQTALDDEGEEGGGEGGGGGGGEDDGATSVLAMKIYALLFIYLGTKILF